MTGKQLFEALTDIDDELIQNAMSSIEKAENTDDYKMKRRKKMNTMLGIAASFAVLFGGSFLLGERDGQEISVPKDNLPQITLEFEQGAMGFEGYLAYDVGDIVTGNPWSKDWELSHLPVFENPLNYDSQFIQSNTDYQWMEETLLKTGSLLGMDVENLPITDDVPDEEAQKEIAEKYGEELPEGYFNASRFCLEDENYKVEVINDYRTEIHFATPVTLPEHLVFTHYATYEQLEAVGEYLLEHYSAIIHMEKPVLNISGGDYNYLGEQMYSISFYEQGESEADSLLNHQFHVTHFYCNDEGQLDFVRRETMDLSEELGNYPLISVQEARDLMDNGNYVTNVPEEFQDIDTIKKVELVYRSSTTSKNFVPYYRFYVELQEQKVEGFSNYGAYYVPAIESEYIANMPLWGGDFNS